MKNLFSFHTRSLFLFQPFLRTTSKNPNPTHRRRPKHDNRLFSDQSCLSSPPISPQIPNPNTNFNHPDFTTIYDLLTNPSFPPGPALEAELDRTGIQLGPTVLQQIFDHFRSSPKLLLTLFLWAERQPGYRSSVGIFNATIKVLTRARQFESAWSLVFNRLKKPIEGPDVDTFSILITRYARKGMPSPAIRTLEFASSLDFTCGLNSGLNLLEILLESFCKEGLVWEASEYFHRKRGIDPSWVPSVHVYNILLSGLFRSRQLERVEWLLDEMKKENVKPSEVTYGILVEGYCKMCHIEVAIELVNEMRTEGIEPSATVYNPIIDALGEAGRLKEALGMMERFLVLESGPTISTYNSLIKGFCKVGDLEGANKILKMMISRGFHPNATTYNYFFKYYSNLGKIEEGLNLYAKMMESGYTPDRLTYHLLMKLLCTQERLDLAMQVRREIKAMGYDLDLAACTMLVHLLCKMHRFEEAFGEFEDMIRRGIVPQYITYEKMMDELKKQGMTAMAQKLHDMMVAVAHSMKLPITHAGDEAATRTRRTSIMLKAKAISDTLKTCRDPRELVKLRGPSKIAVSDVSVGRKYQEELT